MAKLDKQDYGAYQESLRAQNKVHQMALEADEVLLKWLEKKVPKEKKKKNADKLG